MDPIATNLSSRDEMSRPVGVGTRSEARHEVEQGICQESARTWSPLETAGDFPQVGSTLTLSVTCVVIRY